MNDLEKEVRRSSIMLLLAGVGMGILLGIPAGIALVELTTDRVTVITACDGAEV